MTDPKIPWKRLSSRTAYENNWYRIREDQVVKPDGNEGIYGVLESKNSVFIVALNDEKKFALIRLYRYPTEMWSWELPAGGTDGEDPLFAAQKELHEELGMEAKNWERLGGLQALNGICTEVMNVFLATDLHPTDNKRAEEGITETRWVTCQEFEAMVAKGEMSCAQSMAAFLCVRPRII